MFSTFDPYYQWLGIPPHLQPPHHYRLLGLEAFESHLDVILAAADRQMAHVRMYQLGPYAEYSQELLNELASARVCLITPESKAAYDAELRKQLAISAPSSASELETSGKPRLTVHAKEVLERELQELVSPLSPAPRRQPTKSAFALHEPTPALPVNKMMSADPPLVVSSPLDIIDLPPPAPWTNEPPYMAEYRRRFFETVIKIIIFAFLFAIGLMLFNALALPRFKETFKPDPEPAENPASVLGSNEDPMGPPSPPIAPTSEVETSEKAETSEAMPPEPIEKVNDENQGTAPASPKKQSTVSKTPEQLRGEEFFTGCWYIYEGGRYVSSVTLLRNFTARDSRHANFTGTWEYDNNEARITWSDGWHIVLRREGDKIFKASYSPNDTAEFHPLDEGTAIKEDSGSADAEVGKN